MRRFLFGFLLGLLALPCAILIVARLGLFPINSNTTPPASEGRFAHNALDSSPALPAPRHPKPLAPTEEKLMAGVKLFKNGCAGCPGTPNSAHENETNVILYPNAPQFALHPPAKPDYQLFWIVRGGVAYFA